MTQNLQEIATKIGAYSVTLFAVDKVAPLKNIIHAANGNAVEAALKTSALLSGTDYVANMGLEKLGLGSHRGFTSDVMEFSKNFISNAAVLYVIDKFDLDAMLEPYARTDMGRAVVLAVIFTVCNEVTSYALHMLRL
jgi:hypothetical protein